MPNTSNDVEPFPPIEEHPNDSSSPPRSQPTSEPPSPVANRPAASSSLSGRLRRASKGFEESNLPEGFMAATGSIASSIFSMQAATARPPVESPGERQAPATDGSTPSQTLEQTALPKSPAKDAETLKPNLKREPTAAAPFDNGYHFPPRHTFAQSTRLGLGAFWNYVTTPLGFCVTIYGLNVVAWGGMLFLLLCNAAPAMCSPSCDHIDSPRRIWIEYDSQILNALFCVTGFGLAPWRFRDLWFLLQYRLLGNPIGLRRLAGINRGWFRLHGSTELPITLGPETIEDTHDQPSDSAIPFPRTTIPEPPLTGVRARPTRTWKLDAVIWLMVWNTFLQAVLSGFMWGMNRYNRPSWATGLFIGLAFVVAGIAGYMIFLEGKAVNKVEGVPVSEQDLRRLQSDRERGVWHFNNIKDKDLGAQGEKVEKVKG